MRKMRPTRIELVPPIWKTGVLTVKTPRTRGNNGCGSTPPITSSASVHVLPKTTGQIKILLTGFEPMS